MAGREVTKTARSRGEPLPLASMKILHFDSIGGASGDMILGTLIDLGVKPADLNAAIASLDIGELSIEARPYSEQGLHGTQVAVHARERDAHGHGAAQPHAAHAHRNLDDIRRAITASALPDRVKQRSLAVFQRLAEAEAHVHQTSPNDVHFHEVGALDAIADITGACLGLDLLGVDAVSVGPLPIGHGTIACAHGLLPNPAPGTVELLKGHPIAQVDEPSELVTPTGAALLVTWQSLDALPDGCVIRAVGHGFGQRKLQRRPNLLRAMLCEATDAPAGGPEPCLVLETNLDDTNPEWIGSLVPKLLAAGAYDVFTTAIQMKKQRPGILLTVLCPTEKRAALLDLIFTESTTLGVREYVTRRTVLPRESVEVQTPYGAVRVKVGIWQGKRVTHAPEHEDCVRCAEASRVPVRVVYEAALAAYRPATSGLHV
jgi:pyridinium-3,5-bisthiocarboxylic acid mononucleotide nickel chelatase